jgi:dipeptidyl aminopeptidase/acylaminoacyl peptidase
MKPFSIDDLHLHRKVSELHGIAGRNDVVAVVRHVDRDQDDYVANVWLCSLDGTPPRQITHGTGQDSSPRWSPQGDRIAFIASTEAGPQLHLVEPGGGEPTACGEATAGVQLHRWLPDGRSLLITRLLDVDPDRRGRRGPAPGQRRPCKPEVAWRLPYKQDGSGYTLAREVHLFHVELGSCASRQLTDGAFDVHGFDVSPDARQVVYVRHREGRDAHRTDLWLCAIDGSGQRQLTHDLATVMQPTWSPDGRCVAFTGSAAEGDAQTSLFVLEVASGRLRALAADALEVAALNDAVQWSGDGQQLIVARAHEGCHRLVAVDPKTGTIDTWVAGDRQFGAFACAGGRLAYSVESPVQPSELFACAAQAGVDERRVTTFNPWWDERTPLEATRRRFQVPDGEGGEETIQGWLIRARGSAQPQPLLDDVHGGPAAYALLDYDTNVFWQVLCSQGWAVLALNPVGSASHGRRFCQRLAGRWGELDLPQHLAAIEHLQAAGEADARIAISGKSYGGYLSAWATGHTDRFRASVVMAPVGNIETHYGTSDGGYYADPLYLDSAPEFDRRLARELSPLQHIARSTTPTLFLQGKEDERCPKCQSEEMFVTLYRSGQTPAEMVLYPGESHLFLGDGQPDCRADAAGRIVQWLEQHVMGAGASGPRADGPQPRARPRHDAQVAETTTGAGHGSP